MLHRRTVVLMLVILAVIVCANVLTVRVPFFGEQEADGYMVKLGWPCAFREETRHKLIWEQLDLWIDIVVAAAAVLGTAFCSEWVIRNERRAAPREPKISYRTFLVLLLEVVFLLGINLHEYVVDDEPVRGWPLVYTIEGDMVIHHRIRKRGLVVDFVVVGVVLFGTFFITRRKWDAALIRRSEAGK